MSFFIFVLLLGWKFRQARSSDVPSLWLSHIYSVRLVYLVLPVDILCASARFSRPHLNDYRAKRLVKALYPWDFLCWDRQQTDLGQPGTAGRTPSDRRVPWNA